MKNNKYIISLVIIVLVSLNIFSFLKISKLENEIKLSNRRIMDMDSKMSENFITYRNELLDQIEKGESLISDFKYTIGSFNPNTLKLPINFSFIPKEYSEDTKMFLIYNNKELELAKNKDVFSATAYVDIKENINPKIIIENNSIRKVEPREQINIYDLWTIVFPEVYTDGYFETILSKGNLSVYFNTNVFSENYKKLNDSQNLNHLNI